ncbi:unnamed protein product [Umbelopsis vinacea]
MIENYVDNASSLRHGTNNNEKPAVKNHDHLKRTSALFQEPKLEKALVMKLDRHILPLVCILYCFSFLDRVNIGNAKLGGIEESLQLTPTQFSICLALFSVSYIAFEVPANVLLKHFKVNVWISIIMFLWGGITIVTAFVTSFHTLGITRFFLGLFEAGYVPGIMYYLSTFYKRKELATRIAIFLCFNCIAGMISGPIGYASTFLEGHWGMHGWQFLFLIEGIPTTLLSVFCFCFLVRDVQHAKWLTPAQKDYKCSALRKNKPRMATITCFHGSNSNLGFSIGVTQLLVIPINLVGAIAELSAAFAADRMQRRFPLILSGSIIGCLSFLALAVVHNNWVRYALLHFGMIGVTMAAPCILSWASDNWDGSGKAVSMALIICLGNCGGIIASFIFRPSDAPNYVMPFVVFSVMMAAGAGISFFLRTYWKRLNTNRDIGVYDVDITDMTSEQMESLGDRHPAFRYVI